MAWVQGQGAEGVGGGDKWFRVRRANGSSGKRRYFLSL